MRIFYLFVSFLTGMSNSLAAPLKTESMYSTTVRNAAVSEFSSAPDGQLGTVPKNENVKVLFCVDQACMIEWKALKGYISAADAVVGSGQERKSLQQAWDERNAKPVPKATRSALSDTSRLVMWGDSLTAGVGATSPTNSYPSIISRWTSARVENKGVGGETSSQVIARFRQSPDLWKYPTVIWVGRNNFQDAETVKSDIAEMVKSLGHDQYLIGSILNGDYSDEHRGHSNYVTITQLNAYLAKTYGKHFVDVRSALIAQGKKGADGRDIDADIIPASLRKAGDHIHLNDNGYWIAATAFYEARRKLVAN